MTKWLHVVLGILLALVCGTESVEVGEVEVEAAMLAQNGQGNLTVTAGGAPAADVDVFALINAGKQPMGTTSSTGQLPFDPALLTGKVRVEVVVRECPDRREVVLVPGETDDACRDAEQASEGDEDCRCDVAGIIWWGNDLSVDITRLTATGGSGPITSNPLLWVGIGGGAAGAAIALGSGGSDATSTVPVTAGGQPMTSTSSTTTTTSAPPTTTTSTAVDLTGTYGIDVVGVTDPGGHRPFTGDPPNRIDITVNNGNIVATGAAPWVRVNGTIDSSGRFRATGRGTVAGRPNVMVVFEGRIEMTSPHRLTGTYSMGTGGELPGGQAIEFRLDGQMR